MWPGPSWRTRPTATCASTLRQVTPDKPMSFTSFNGNVDVTLPAAVKANLKLRSDQGEVYTDFDVQIQQQHRHGGAKSVQVAPAPPLPPLPPAPPGADTRERERQARARTPGPRARTPDARAALASKSTAAIYGTVNGGGPEFELRTFNGDVFLRKGK